MPDGQITSCSNCAVSIPPRKNIPLGNSDNQNYIDRVHPTEGRYANVTNAVVGCDGRQGELDERAEADGEVVWS